MDLLDELERRVVLADGAMGTELLAAGASSETCLEELCVSAPDTIRRIHEAYLAAGAEIIRTNTFGANSVRLARFGLEHRVSEINWTAAQLAKECAKSSGALVGGSVGPLGPSARDDRESLFLEQIGALLDGGARVIFLETFTDLDELLLAVNAKHTLHHCPVVAMLACSPAGLLPDGTSLAEAWQRLKNAEADIVGINCVGNPAETLSARQTGGGISPLACFPSAGLPQITGGRATYSLTPEAFAETALPLTYQGVHLLGGCCGAGPAHLAALHRRLHPLPAVADA